MEKPLITVIVPVYNVEPYLEKCIDSILNQSYENLEVILVDDGSTDESWAICDRYKKIDKRISVIHKVNGGLSDARNVAIDVMQGEYVTFVDSDDYIDSKMVERLYELALEYDAEIACVSFAKIFKDKKVKQLQHEINVVEYTGFEAMEQIMYKKNINPSAWSKLYKKEVFKEIRYPKGKIFEDLATTYKLFYRQRKVVVSNEVLYFYLQRCDSIMYQKFQKNRMDRIEATQNMIEWCEANEPKLRDAAEFRFFLANVQVLREMPLTKEWKNEKKEIEANLKKYRKKIIRNKNVKFVNKLIAYSTWLGIYPLKCLGIIYKIVWP